MPCGGTMDDWKQLIGEAMQIETTDTIAAFKIYERAVFAGLSTAQNLLDDVEAAQIIEAIYGALVAYSQTVMLRMKAEDPEIGGVDHAFRAGQAYGVSCVLNHLIDKLTDITGGTELGAMDAFSDTLHDEIIIQTPKVLSDKVSNIVQKEMEDSSSLKVPLFVDIKENSNLSNLN